ncbi:MAG: long-chain fatty acid--CoA ligase [Verrucomicrobia bacterium]|nr:long-chain fatty acid--CoA ligase [Verrucomicrobiota bacterium]
MLYDRWRQIVAQHRAERALCELASGRQWTFGELDRATDAPSASGSDLAYPRGHTAEFVLGVVRAWRSGRVVCPLEPDQAPPTVPRPPPGCVHLKITSATGGQPRAVAFTAAQLAADAANVVATMGLRPDWPNLGVISLAHSYGFSNLVTPLLLHGIPLILAPAPLPEVLRCALAAEPALTVPAVPALWRTWLEARVIHPHLQLAISAGAPLPSTLERAMFLEHGLKVHNFYGSTECGGIAYDNSPAPRADETCVGTPLLNVTVAVNELGCLEVRSPAVGQTYWPEPDRDLANGCFHTSDLAELEGDRVCLRGRYGDVINVAGRKVSPDLIERALGGHPEVRSCVVFGAPAAHAERGEVIVAAVAAAPTTNPRALQQHLLERLPAWQVPRAWWFVDDIAPNVRGKTSRAQWRAAYSRRATSTADLA